MTRVRIAPPATEEDVSAEQVAAYLLRDGWRRVFADSWVHDTFTPVTWDTRSSRGHDLQECIHDIARAEQRHPSAVLADIVGPARAASVGAYCEPWLFVAELRVRLSCKLPACDRMGCSAARGAGESEE